MLLLWALVDAAFDAMRAGQDALRFLRWAIAIIGELYSHLED